MKKITKEQFFKMVGSNSINDDLERCNCNKVGQLGHWSCGICEKCNKPRFICGHILKVNK